MSLMGHTDSKPNCIVLLIVLNHNMLNLVYSLLMSRIFVNSEVNVNLYNYVTPVKIQFPEMDNKY